MNSRAGFSLPIILAIAAVVLVAGGVGAFLYVTNNTNPNLESKASYTPAPQSTSLKTDSEPGFKTPEEKKASPTAVPLVSVTSLVTTTANGVDVSTALSLDKKTFTINFQSSTGFSGISSISYNLTYTADSGPRGISGAIIVNHSVNLIIKVLDLGTCSGTTCVYDVNPRAFSLSVSTK